MIITVTLNPALDKTVEVDSLLLGGLNRLRNVTIDAGGKGINVSKMISALGGQSIATGYVGGSSGDELLHRLEKLKIQHSFVSVQDTTRTNLKVVSAEGVTELNEPGVQVTESEHTSLRRKLLSYSAPDTLYVLSGSLPRNADRSLYKTLTQELRSTGAKVFVDA
ncbi:PfkB family carbohydrate kinase, partial [Hydrogenoanaerobacterium sp.]|uniref:1-phosphofructokinase family hexose kinase n=1 Tax=Hydrogenoanaerobacterium sp. TaxID=2953763 RepID=UPI00289994CF